MIIILFPVILLLIIGLTFKAKPSTFKKVLISILTIVLLLTGGFYVYVSSYYHAEDINDALQSDSKVIVTHNRTGYVFHNRNASTALIFYPGGKVETSAYAPLMKRLAHEGIDCFLCEMRFHLAMFSYKEASRIIRTTTYDHYYLAGHSLGGVFASYYASQMPSQIDGIIMLAAYPSRTVPDSCRYFTLYGSQDGILKRKAYQQAKKYWPKEVQEYVLNGGNHAQFGNYGDQKGDHPASITTEKQQEITAQQIIRFMKGDQS